MRGEFEKAFRTVAEHVVDASIQAGPQERFLPDQVRRHAGERVALDRSGFWKFPPYPRVARRDDDDGRVPYRGVFRIAALLNIRSSVTIGWPLCIRAGRFHSEGGGWPWNGDRGPANTPLYRGAPIKRVLAIPP